MRLRRKIAAALLPLIYRVEYHLFASGEVAGIRILDRRASDEDRAQLEKTLREALRYLKREEEAHRAVTTGLAFIAIARHRSCLIAAPPGLVLDARRGIPTNSFGFALSLIWNVRALELARQCVPKWEYEPACFEAQIAFAKRFPDAGGWVRSIEQVRDERASRWNGWDTDRSDAGEPT